MPICVITGVTAHAEADLAAVLGSAADVALVRRCADLAEVLSVSAAGRAEVAFVSADLPGLDRSSVRELADHGVRVIGVYTEEQQERSLREWGIDRLVEVQAAAEQILDQVHAAAATTPAPPVVAPQPLEDPPPEPADPPARGTVIAVWGTGGAPGRSVIAANLAVEFAATGQPTLLIDADTYGASQAQMFGILDEAPGVAAAARLAEAGRLDTVSLAGVAPLIAPVLRVLTGLPRADRWPELRTAALEAVLDTARTTHCWVLVDVAAPTDVDEELSYDTVAPQRNMATRGVLQAADEVFVLAAGDPVSLSRLTRVVDELDDLTSAPRTVMVTKVRASAAGRHPQAQIQQALQRFSGLDPVLVPDDRDGLDAALLAGRSLAEMSPSSPVVGVLRDVVQQRSGLPAPRRSRSRRSGLLRRTG